jgi:hypothetical protein
MSLEVHLRGSALGPRRRRRITAGHAPREQPEQTPMRILGATTVRPTMTMSAIDARHLGRRRYCLRNNEVQMGASDVVRCRDRRIIGAATKFRRGLEGWRRLTLIMREMRTEHEGR